MSDHDLLQAGTVSDPGPLLGPPLPEPDRTEDAGLLPVTISPTRRNRWNLLLGAVVVVVLVGAGALAYRAHRTDAEASDLRADAAALDRQSDQLGQRADEADVAAAQLDAAVSAANDHLGRVVAAIDSAAQMHDAFVDSVNKAVQLYNSGHLSAAHDVWQGEGAAALANFQDSVAALDRVLADAQAAAQHLQEANHV